VVHCDFLLFVLDPKLSLKPKLHPQYPHSIHQSTQFSARLCVLWASSTFLTSPGVMSKP
jgi:hypothetical protein